MDSVLEKDDGIMWTENAWFQPIHYMQNGLHFISLSLNINEFNVSMKFSSDGGDFVAMDF